MSLAHDYRAELHAQHVARRQRMGAAAKQQRVTERALLRAECEVVRLSDTLERTQAALDQSESRFAELAREASEVIAPVSKKWRAIAAECLDGTAFTMADLTSARRTAPIVRVRHHVCYRLATETAMSYPAIGRALGGRDHTTILSGVRAHAKRNGLPCPVGSRA